MNYIPSASIITIETLSQATSLIVTFAGLVAGAIITVFLQHLLSDEVKIKIKYHSNHIKKRLSDSDITFNTKIVRRYELNEEADLYQLSNELWDKFGVQATGQNDHFEFSKNRGDQTLDVDVRLFHEEVDTNQGDIETVGFSDLQSDGGTEHLVDSIRIEVGGALSYNRMKDLLFREYDLLRDIESSIPRNLEGKSYSFTCDSEGPPQVNHALSSMEFSSFRMENKDIELEYTDEELKIRDHDQGEVDQIIDVMYKLVTLYA